MTCAYRDCNRDALPNVLERMQPPSTSRAGNTLAIVRAALEGGT